MSVLKDFREFAVRGNVIDLAVGVIIGASFGKIVSSLVDDLIMPPIGAVLGKVDFADLKIQLTEAQTVMKDGKPVVEPAVTLNYGSFINVLVQFLIVAWVVFLLVKALNRAKARFEEPPAETSDPVVKECPFCLSEIPFKAGRCKFCAADFVP